LTRSEDVSDPADDIWTCGFGALRFGGPDAVDVVAVPPRNDVEMQVEHRLLSGVASRSDQVHALWLEHIVESSADGDTRSRKIRRGRRAGLPKVAHVGSRHYQRVTMCRRVERKERNPALSLAHDLSVRIRAIDDAAERAVRLVSEPHP